MYKYSVNSSLNDLKEKFIKRVFPIIALAVLMVSPLSPFANGQKVEALSPTYYVSQATGDDANTCDSVALSCKTIGAAVALANTDTEVSTISVDFGTYTENVQITSPTNLVGVGNPKLISASGYTLEFKGNAASGSSVSGFNITSSATGVVLKLEETANLSNIEIKNNVFSSTGGNLSILIYGGNLSLTKITNNTFNVGSGVKGVNIEAGSITNTFIGNVFTGTTDVLAFAAFTANSVFSNNNLSGLNSSYAKVVEFSGNSNTTAGNTYGENQITVTYGANNFRGVFSTFAKAIDVAQAGDTLTLNSDISINQSVKISKPITIEGNNHTLIAGFANTADDNSNNAVININGTTGVAINNLVADADNKVLLNVINAYSSTVALNGVVLKNSASNKFGLVVNDSTVTANNLRTANNGYAGVNVDKGSAALIVNGSSVHNEGNKDIYIDDVNNSVGVTDNENQYVARNAVVFPNDKLYTLKTSLPVKNVNTNEYFSTIQDAINDSDTAVDGNHVIEVKAGVYNETVNVTKSVDIRGPNYQVNPNDSARSTEAVLSNTISARVFSISSGSTNVSIDGFKFDGGSPINDGNDTSYPQTSDVSFRNNIVINSNNIYAGNSTAWRDLIIENNSFTDVNAVPSASAMQLINLRRATIKNNTFVNVNYSAILLDSIAESTITGNSINSTGAQAIQLAGTMGAATVENNNITNANFVAQSADKGAISLYGSDFSGAVLVKNNIISGGYNGVTVRNGQNITGKNIIVTKNSITGLAGGNGVYNGGTGLLSAERNWWGSATGPTDTVSGDFSIPETNTGGVGSRAVNAVNYADWCTDSTCTPIPPTKVGESVIYASAYYTSANGFSPNECNRDLAIPRCETIQDAINTAKDGDTIKLIGNFSITKQITLNKSVTIDGQNGNSQSTLWGENFTDPITYDNNSVFGLQAPANIVNLTINGKNHNIHGINAWHTNGDATVWDVTLKNLMRSGLNVGEQARVVAGNLTSSGNGWNTIDVDKTGAWLKLAGTNNFSEGPMIPVVYFDSWNPAKVQFDNVQRYVYVGNYVINGDRAYFLVSAAPDFSNVKINSNPVILEQQNCTTSGFNFVRGTVGLSTDISDGAGVGIDTAFYRVVRVGANGCIMTNANNNYGGGVMGYNSGNQILTGPNGSTWTGSFDTKTLPSDGNYAVMMTVKNMLGITTTRYIDLTVDNTNPTIINAKISAILVRSVDTPTLSADVNGTGSDVTRAQYRIHTKSGAEVAGFGWVDMQALDGTFDGTTEGIVDLMDLNGLVDGEYIARIRAFDEAGNKKSGIDVAFTVDNTAPQSIFTTISTEDTTPAVSGGVDSPDVASVTVKINGLVYSATVTGTSWVVADGEVAALTVGSYDVEVTLTDPTGNVSVPKNYPAGLVIEETTPLDQLEDEENSSDDNSINRDTSGDRSVLSLTTNRALTPIVAVANAQRTPGANEISGDAPVEETQAISSPEVLAAETSDNGDSNNETNKEEIKGCFKIFGLCWYWWIIPVAVILGYTIYRFAKEDEEK